MLTKAKSIRRRRLFGRRNADAGRGRGDAAAEGVGVGIERIARELGCSHMTLDGMAEGGYVTFRAPGRAASRVGWAG